MIPTTITVYLRKGGVAKSTLVMLLGYFLAGLGFKVVILDLDRQGSQSIFFDLVDETGRGGEIMHQVLRRRIDMLAALTPVVTVPMLNDYQPGALWVAQGGPQTPDAVADIATNPVRYKVANTLDIVRGPIQQLTGHVDYVLIDMGPSDQVTALAALVATDYLIIPTTMDYPSVTQIAPVMDEVEVARQVQPGLQVAAILPTLTRSYFGGLRRPKNAQVGEEYLRSLYADLLMTDEQGIVEMPYSEKVNEAVWAALPLLGEQISRLARADLLRVCNALAARIGLEGVKVHV